MSTPSMLSFEKLKSSFERMISESFFQDSFSFLGDTITLRSLSKNEYDEIAAEMVGFETSDSNESKKAQYITEYCYRHLSRSIVEVGGVNFRGVSYVDLGHEKVPVQLFLKENFLSRLSHEAFNVLWNKFNEVVEQGEKKNRQGVVFITPDERPDEKIERLLKEASLLLTEVPESLVKRILEKYDYPVGVVPTSPVDTGDTTPDTDPAPPPSEGFETIPEVQPVRDASSLPLNLPPLKPSSKAQAFAELEGFVASAPVSSIPASPLPVETPSYPPRQELGKPVAVPVDQRPPQNLNPRYQPSRRLLPWPRITRSSNPN